MMDESRGNYASWEYTNWEIAFSTEAGSPDSWKNFVIGRCMCRYTSSRCMLTNKKRSFLYWKRVARKKGGK